MVKEEFNKELSENLTNLNTMFHVEHLEQFYTYMKILLEWNSKMNLTAIIDPKEIITKHFIDSITVANYINNNSSVIDIGTGAGFPGMPLAIINNTLKVTLVDSLNKRINFLKEVSSKINLSNVNAIHARAEDLGQNKLYREEYNVAVSRAVAKLNVLVEYMLPLVKIGGKCICMKGPDYEQELEESKKAIELLGGKLEKVDKIVLPNSNIQRTFIIIKKETKTPSKYPRKAGTQRKDPII